MYVKLFRRARVIIELMETFPVIWCFRPQDPNYCQCSRLHSRHPNAVISISLVLIVSIGLHFLSLRSAICPYLFPPCRPHLAQVGVSLTLAKRIGCKVLLNGHMAMGLSSRGLCRDLVRFSQSCGHQSHTAMTLV